MRRQHSARLWAWQHGVCVGGVVGDVHGAAMVWVGTWDDAANLRDCKLDP